MTLNGHLQVAYHEAGHAVERFLLDYEVIELHFDFAEGQGGCIYEESDQLDYEDEICCLLAGSVAQSMFLGVEWSIERMLMGGDGHYGPAEDDLNRATESARVLLGNHHETGSEAYRSEAVHIENDALPAFAETVGVHLKGGWDLVRVVAEALIRGSA